MARENPVFPNPVRTPYLPVIKWYVEFHLAGYQGNRRKCSNVVCLDKPTFGLKKPVLSQSPITLGFWLPWVGSKVWGLGFLIWDVALKVVERGNLAPLSTPRMVEFPGHRGLQDFDVQRSGHGDPLGIYIYM